MVRPHDRARQGIHKGAMQDHDLMTGPLDSRRRPGQQPFSLVGQSRVSQVAEDIDHLLDSLISVYWTASSPYLIAKCAHCLPGCSVGLRTDQRMCIVG